MSSTTMEWSTPMTRRLISLWKDLPCLYARDDLQYKNRAVRNAAISSICSALCVPREEILRKMHNLRCSMNSELRKHRDRIKKNINPHPSQWKFFRQLEFIANDSGLPSVDSGDSSSESSDQPGFLTSKVVVNVGQDQVPVKRYYGVLDGANFFLETDPADETPANSSHQEDASDDVVLVSPSDLLRNDYESDGQEYQSTVENSHSEKSQNGAYSKTKIDKVQNHTPNRIEKTPFKRNHTFLEEDDPEDDFTAFGKFVASEMRQMRSDERKKRLKRSILRSILDACEEDDLEYSISFSPICDKPKTEPALISTENKL